ncbi:Leucine-rich repeat receptor protein kinase [Quillaja saponaria]|uniref:Leucine-rich repeat receptor protein kinase n=1 Tax=Quillaja saponaria TaxID=32244 RepID=A0AAD7PVN9_QUISA|nr:Leucine-rich repeat receptor protein kinase [Quillaja saponaria]
MTTPFAILLPLLLLSISCHGASNMTCNEKERQVLLSFKQKLNDPSNRLVSWSAQQQDCCKWIGVTCNNITGRVTELNLTTPLDSGFLELSGEINPSLLELKFLTHLDLSLNYFVHSTIPSFLGSLESLRHLDLSFSGFKGLIPRQLGNLSNLQYLDLGYNYALSVDNLDWVSSLSSLEYLGLSGVDLHEQLAWPQVLCTLPSILELHLVSCQIDDNMIPPEVHSNFTSLQVLDLANNNLNHGIPPWISNFSTSLSELDLGNNFMQGEIPHFILEFQRLKKLDLQGNQFNGRIPESIVLFKHLESIILHNNSFNGPFPSSLVNLTFLRMLNLGHNQLNGSFPETLGFLSNLEELYLGNNLLTGGVPKTIGLLSNLVTLDVSSNSLEGPVEEEHFSKLSKLKQLHLSSTNLFLNVSAAWVPRFQLDFLLMGSCRVGPRFPTWLQIQKSLRILMISKSGISDMVPRWFWNWTVQLEFMDLSSNQISGNISAGVLFNSSTINLSSNNFKGQVPRLSNHVEVLNIANNSLSGPISQFFCEKLNWKNKLAVLDISNNLLSGDLGRCWMHWQSLMHLNLGSNQLFGEIHDSIGNLYGLESLRLNHNSFSGYVPSTLQNCSLLRFIDIGENKLSDTIPLWMWEMESLLVIRLRSNQFSGVITEKLCQLSSLIVLDLANNSLSGTIPNCWNNIKAMVVADDINSNPLQYSFGYDNNFDSYKQSLTLSPKGGELEYKDNLILVRIIDLSSNKFSGPIPSEISSLAALRFLNLAKNSLSGEI